MTKEGKRLRERAKRAKPFGAPKEGKSVPLASQSMKVGRGGKIKGATYEQLTGEEAPRVRTRRFGQTWDESQRSRRGR